MALSLPTTIKQEARKKFEKFIGFNDRGTFYYSDDLSVSGYKNPYTVCRNCGAKVRGKAARELKFGHVGCPKPNGYFLRNDFTAEDLLSNLDSLIDQTAKRVVEEIIGKLDKADTVKLLTLASGRNVDVDGMGLVLLSQIIDEVSSLLPTQSITNTSKQHEK